jgi:hypothetical protein
MQRLHSAQDKKAEGEYKVKRPQGNVVVEEQLIRPEQEVDHADEQEQGTVRHTDFQ